MPVHLRRFLIQLQHVAGLQDKDVFLRDAQIPCDIAVRDEVLVFAVNRDRILRLHQRIDQLEILLAGVTGDMHILEDDVRALHQQFVDDVRHGLFVAGDRVGREDDRVIPVDRDFLMLAARHAGERRHAFALGAGGDDGRFVCRIIPDLLNINQGVFRHLDVAQLFRDVDRRHHAAPLHDHLPSVLICGIDDLLHAVHIGRKGRDDDARVFVLRKDRVHRVTDGPFGGRVARPLRVGGIRQQRQHALFADLRKALQINRITEDRGVIHLEIPGVHDDADRCVDGQRRRIHDRMIRADEFDMEIAERDRGTEAHDLALHDIQHVVLFQLVLDQAHRQARRIDRNIDVPENIRE